MTICQFYLEGRCRFGQNCRNEHVNNNDNRNRIQSGGSTTQLNSIVRQIVSDVIAAEKGGQWPLSCFSPVKEGANIPGWEDISPDEVRWKMYEARNNGMLNQCINEVNQLYRNAEKRRNALKQPTMDKINLIVNMLKEKRESVNISNPFNQNNSNNIGNIFGGSTLGTNNQNLFGCVTATSGNIFGGSPQPTGLQSNVFGGVSPQFSNQNIFGGSSTLSNSNQNFFSNTQSSHQNLFSNSSSMSSSSLMTNQNVFSNTQVSMAGNQINQNIAFSSSANSNIFSNEASTAPLFGTQNTFFQGVDNNTQTQTSIFGGNSSNIFGGQNSYIKGNADFYSQPTTMNMLQNQSQPMSMLGSKQQNAIDYSVYSKKEDLTAEELAAFSAATFSFGKIPLKPPAVEFCK